MNDLIYSVAHTIVVGNGGSGGMPQLNPESFPSQLFWLLITFVVLHFFMAKSIIPRIREVMEKRQTQIDHDINAAEKAKNDAQKARQSYEQSLSEARDKANEAIAEAQGVIDRMVSEENAKLDLKLAKEMAKTEAQIAAQAENATVEVLPIAKELAGMIAEQISDKKPTVKILDAAMKTALKG